MYKNSHLQKFLSILFVVALLLTNVQASVTSAQGSDGAKRQVNAETGKVSFIGPENGRVLSASQALGTFLRPQDPGKALAKRFAPEFGLQNAERDLSEMKSRRGQDGRLTVRYQQTYQGIPVLGGELIVNTNERGDLYSMNGEVSPNLSLQTQPGIDSAQAAETALQAIAKWYQKKVGDFKVSDPALWIFDESLLQPSSRPVELVWRMEVTPRTLGLPVRELVLVNAQRGSISLHFNQVDTAWEGSQAGSGDTTTAALPSYTGPAVLGSPLVDTWTANKTSDLFNQFLCDETQPNCTNGANPHADAAHKYAIGTYNLYATKHLRDSINNAGMTIVSSVHYRKGYANAFWNGEQMVYGDAYGFPLADDVVGHELTHGVTEYESNLIYFYQSGAMNESFSDVWGEYYDQTNGLANDAPNVKWLLGENVTGFGAIRNMKNPPQFKDPDKMTSSLYYKGAGDGGGVHTNSGVNNKAVYLMVDGGVFNGRTVAGMDWDKTAAIYYEAQTNLLGSGSNYSDLYYALQQACSTLISGAQDITLEDCRNVQIALDAVEMNKPISTKTQITAPLCPSNMTPSTTLFEDQFEGGLGNWTASSQWGLSTDIASSPTHSVWGNDFANFLLETMSMNAGVVIQPNTYLHFDHAYDFDNYAGVYYDGAVVEYSTNGGASWNDIGPLFSAGAKYGGTILNYPQGSALGGRKGFVGTSYAVSSRYDLSSLSGQTVRIRFQFATDEIIQYSGWYIDDVMFYTCVNMPTVPVLQSPLNNAFLTDYGARLLDWSDTLTGLDHYQVQVADENTFETPLYDDDTLVSQYQLPGLTPNTQYFWRVRSFNSSDDTQGWSNTFSFKAAIVAPTLTAPDDLAMLTTRRPLFDWDDVAGATGYKLVVSKYANLSSPLLSLNLGDSSQYLPTADLPAKTKLYWRVQAKGPNGPSLNSVTRSFKTGNPPSVPVLKAPANNALTKDYTPLLDWGTSALPTGTAFLRYEVQVDDNNDFSSPVIDVSTASGMIGDSKYTPGSDLADNTKYFWRVRAVNDVSGVEHVSGWSKVWTFRAAMLPPVLLLPANESTEVTLKPVFDWEDVTGAVSYTIQISVDPKFGTFLVNKPVSVSTFTPTTNLPKNRVIYWRVRANGLNGPSNYSKFQFTTPNP